MSRPWACEAVQDGDHSNLGAIEVPTPNAHEVRLIQAEVLYLQQICELVQNECPALCLQYPISPISTKLTDREPVHVP